MDDRAVFELYGSLYPMGWRGWWGVKVRPNIETAPFLNNNYLYQKVVSTAIILFGKI